MACGLFWKIFILKDKEGEFSHFKIYITADSLTNGTMTDYGPRYFLNMNVCKLKKKIESLGNIYTTSKTAYDFHLHK